MSESSSITSNPNIPDWCSERYGFVTVPKDGSRDFRKLSDGAWCSWVEAQAKIDQLARERDEARATVQLTESITARMERLARGRIEEERDRLRALLRDAARQIRSDSGPCPVDMTSRVGLLLTRIDLQLKDSSDETSQKPTDSELYGSSELFRHVWFCPMGWVGDKLIYGPGYTSADMKQWLIGLRRLVGFNTPEGVPLESPPKAGEKS